MSQYQELRNHVEKETAMYTRSDKAKGGYYAGFLGRRAENDLQWQHVNIMKAGKRTITIGCFSGEERDFSVEVNGQFVKTVHVPDRGWDERQTFDIEVDFKKGDNVVRLYNAKAWMPDIDGMEIESR